MRERLLDAAQELVQDRGFNGVSFQALADAVGLKKPSVFHHFRSKEDLASSLLERCRTTYGARYAEILERTDLDEPSKLRGIAAVFEEGLRENHLCLLGALSGNCSTFSDALKRDMEETAKLVIQRYAQVFAEGRTAGTLAFEGSPEDAGGAFLAMLQGLQVLVRAMGNLDAFRPAAESYVDSITRGGSALRT